MSESHAGMNRSVGTADGKRIVLVLDDDSAVRDSLKFSLGIEGFEVRTYSSASDLLNEAKLPASSWVPFGMRLEFGGAISGSMKVSFQAARSIS